MLNRTNRTLSANTNRLNLGTRNLALLAGDNHGSSTLRTAHAIPVVVVRTGIKDHPGILLEAPPIKAGPKRRKPSMMSEMSGSSPRLSSPARDFRARFQGQAARLSAPTETVDVPRGVVVRGRVVTPQVSPSQGLSRSSLDWRCDRPRRADRLSRAEMGLVPGSSPTS